MKTLFTMTPLALAFSLPIIARAEGSWDIAASVNELHMQIDFLDHDVGISGGTKDAIGARVLKTEDGGYNWRNTFDDPTGLVGITGTSWDGPQTAFASGVGWILGPQSIWRSQDGGESWSGVWGQSAFSWMTTLQVPEPDVVIAVGYWTQFLVTKYGMLYSSNGGNSWTKRAWSFNNYPDTAWPTCLDFVNGDEGFIAGGRWPWDSAATHLGRPAGIGMPENLTAATPTWEAMVEGTLNAGQSWTTLFQQTGWTVTGIDFVNRNEGWIVGYYSYSPNQTGPYLGHIFHTDDGGASWEEQNYANSSEVALFNVQMFNRREGWAVGHNDGAANRRAQLYHTVDGGASWSLSSYHVNCDPRGMDFVDESEGWVSGFYSSSQGRYLHYSDPARQPTLALDITEDHVTSAPGSTLTYHLEIESLIGQNQTADMWLSATSPAIGALSPYPLLLQANATIPGGAHATVAVSVDLPPTTPAGRYNLETISGPYMSQDPTAHLGYAGFDVTIQ